LSPIAATSVAFAAFAAVIGMSAGRALAAESRDIVDGGPEAGLDGGPTQTWRVMGPLIEPVDPLVEGTRSCPSCARACSFRHPFCVERSVESSTGPHAAGARKSADERELAALDAADRAWDTLTGPLEAPPPDGDDDGVWRIELRDAVDGGGDAWFAARDPVSRFDRASSFATIDQALGPGCALDLAAARAIARGSMWRAAPAIDEASARAEAEVLARLATPCAASGLDAPMFQASPEETVVAASSPAYERGASAFFGWLDTSFGSEPGALLLGLWSLAPTRTPFDASRWAGAPTHFDVLRTSLRDGLWPGSTLDDVFVRFALARATMAPPARIAWSVPWPASARRLASPRPVAPTGASYVVVDHAGAPPGSKLRVEAAWEDYGRLRWVVAKLDATGHATGEVSIPSLDRSTHTSMTIESLDGVDRLLIVCVNVGSTEHPFDPDQSEWEPHGWLLTLEGE
jgi:hypothetical protein